MNQDNMNQDHKSQNNKNQDTQQQAQQPATETGTLSAQNSEHISEQEWRDKLTEDAYRVLREKGTERPFSGALLDESRDGVYVCAGCKQPLFTADTKFDAGCGWPSFYASLPKTVEYHKDYSHGMQRIEILCANCGGHLGHVFPDGPAPTGQRYCVNSVAMEFEPE